ncbi:MAG: hypothetical protein HBSAPP02_13240 [Phycisphaerae bacterium]|nr:MAG: hypothetical protein DCC66_04850 [Planctomycetota bacterium]GJQ26292.1 MAG: hypothetical protein HBSAPP02_13240 [Phycisphaerae bacterium]
MHASMGPRPQGAVSGSPDLPRLSYKFQRLREQLRQAILTGELTGRLPGERALGRRFEANAKTINKALCDLSSEGLVTRRIGRGTFVISPAAATEKSARVYSCHMPDALTAAPHRAALIDRLRAALAASGHRLVTLDRPQRGRAAVKIDPSAVEDRNGNGHAAGSPSRTVDGVFCIPADPLGMMQGEPTMDLLAEVLRRQLAFVQVGAPSSAGKVCTVVPDYVDAGFRLAEYLYLRGCTRVAMLASALGSSALNQVLTGAQTCAARSGRVAVSCEIASPPALVRIASGGSAEPIGVIAIGAALKAVLNDASMVAARRGKRMVMAALGEPCETQAVAAKVTSYDVDATRLTNWAAKLAMEHRAGQRPVEIIVPGQLCVRDGGAGLPQRTPTDVAV